MEIYLAKRMRTLALRQYELCRAVLRRELAVDPDEATTAIYRRCLGHDAPAVAATHEDNNSAQPVAGLLTLPGDDRAAPRMIGRSQALAALHDSRAEALDRGSRLIVVCGEPGIGKSRSVQDFARGLAEQDVAVCHIRARRAERSLSLMPWRELLESRVQAQPYTSLGARDARVPWDGGPSDRMAGGAVIPDRNWRRGFDAVVHALGAELADRPTVVVLEDLHWFDLDSLRLVGYAVRRLADLPVLFAATARTDLGRDWRRLCPVVRDLEEAGRARCLPLEPLGREESEVLIDEAAAMRGIARPGRARHERIWELSEGNPAIALSCLAPECIDKIDTGDGLPEALRRDIARRLARVGPSARALAEAASVLGARSAFLTLAEVAGMQSDAALVALSELAEAGLIRTEGDEVVFVQGRHRLALYRQMHGPRRSAMHAAASHAIARRNASCLPQVHRVLARHLSAADRRGPALEHVMSAAQVDLDRGDRGAAREALRGLLRDVRHLGRAPRAEALAWRARLRLAEIAEVEGDIARALRLLRALERRADSLGKPAEQVRLLYALSRLCRRAQRDDDSHGYARRTLRAERKVGAGVWLPAERLLFRAHLFGGSDGRAANRLSDHIERACRLRLPRDEVGAAEALAVLSALRGRFDTTERQLDRALRAAGTVDDPRLMAGTLMIAGLVRTWVKDSARAIAALDRARDLATGAGDIIRGHAVLGHLGFALLEARRLDEAVANLRDAAGAARALGMAAYLPVFIAGLAAAAAAAGNRTTAEYHARDAWRTGTAANQPWARGLALRTLVGLRGLADSPDPASAERAARWVSAEQRAFGFDVGGVRA